MNRRKKELIRQLEPLIYLKPYVLNYTDGQIFEISKLSEKAGLASESVVTIYFFYTISVAERTNVRFGSTGGFNFLYADYSTLHILNPK